VKLPALADLQGTARWLTAEDGIRLRIASFPAGGKAPGRGPLLFLNGMSEFIEKHLETVADLQARGFAVTTMDWRSQGMSGRALPNRHKSHIGDFQRFLADLDLVLREVMPAGPLTLMGHSMGGHLALRLAHEFPDRVRRVVLIAPMADILMPPGTHWLAQTAAIGLSWFGLEESYAPGAADYGEWRERFDGNILTSDPVRFAETVAQIRLNPELAIGGPTVGWVRAAFCSIDEMRAAGYIEAITAPVLIVGAGRDALVDTEAQKAVAARLPRGRFVVFEESLHEILRERDEIRARFWQVFDAFIAETEARGGEHGRQAQG
jgi:lysophospholipase